MNEIEPVRKSRKRHGTFLKIYIKTDDIKLNIIPIPLWLAKGTISFILRTIKLFMRLSKKEFDSFSTSDINEVLTGVKSIIKEIRRYPPFSIVEIETGDTKISIRTK
ncbi:hypothetical protein KHQ81_15075 [Mycoplasmatota bacterium]|nr:hypothetical protein KHQ81_15075 [Mycoplasmatota bacterium]